MMRLILPLISSVVIISDRLTTGSFSMIRPCSSGAIFLTLKRVLFELSTISLISLATLLCPNCNIPLIRQAQSENSNKQQVSTNTAKTSSFPKIDAELCIGCGICIDICPAEAIHIEAGKAKITIANCKKCRACVNACPVKAIT